MATISWREVEATDSGSGPSSGLALDPWILHGKLEGPESLMQRHVRVKMRHEVLDGHGDDLFDTPFHVSGSLAPCSHGANTPGSDPHPSHVAVNPFRLRVSACLGI